MRKKLIASLSILAIFGFAIAAFAYTQNTSTAADKPSCCKSKDSCPMKAKGHEGNADHSKMDCCGDSCPMKKKGESAAATAASADDKSCCCDCCGDSCPMKKDGAAAATAASAEGKSCCDNCDCCKGEKETSV